MKKVMKKIMTGVVSVSILLSSGTIGLADEPFIIHERLNSEKITGGVSYENLQRFTSDGWWNINVLRIDLNDEYTDIDTIFSDKGVSHKETITNMVKSSNAIAGINGDFFWKTNNNYPIGTMIADGEFISTPDYVPNEKAVFSITNEKVPFITYWKTDIAVKSQWGHSIKVVSKNKDNSLYESVCMYDKNWSEKTIGNTIYPDMTEVIVKDGVVIDIRMGQEPVDMPEDGYILVGRNQAKNTLLNSFRIGDKVRVEKTSVPDFEEIKMAVGGGAILVKNGTIPHFSHNITGNHPRTAIGITNDRSELIMVTIDGRNASFKGVSQERLAQIMIELGAYEAINLDGGGSTTMAIAYQGEENPVVVNHPSDGGQRRVINGLGVFNDAPKMPLKHIEIETDDTNIFVNTTRRFNIKGYDENYNPVEVDLDEVKFRIEGIKGKFEDNILTTKEIGTGIIKAEYEGKTSTIKVKVLDELKDVVIDPDNIYIDTNSEMYINNIYGKNNEGYIAKIEFDDIKWEVIGNVGEIEKGTFYSGKEEGYGAIIATLGNALENITVSVGYNRKLIDGFENIDNIQLDTYPREKVIGDIEKSKNDKEGKYSIELSYDFSQTDENRAAYIKMNPNNNTFKQAPSKLGMWVYGNGSGHWLRGTLKDSNGNIYKVDFANEINWNGWKWVTGKMPRGVSYPASLENIYVVQIDPLKKDVGKLLFDGLEGLYPIKPKDMVLPDETTVKDPLQKHSELKDGGYKVAVTNGIDKANNLLKYHIGERIKDNINNSEFGIIMGSMNKEFENKINKPILEVTNGYSTITYKDTLFIQLDDNKKGIRATDPKQWLNFKKKLKGSKEKNIIILLPKPVLGNNGFIDKLEADLFNEELSKYSNNGRNVFVIHGGKEIKTDVKSGIRYIQFTGNTDKNIDVYDLKQLVFTVNNDEITYEIQSLF
ncbi:phosphodiester glycosidase family protein [Dethiothermospora halolimnae]|uniref:phosphodiester glycosidase family protein n=1 Tax=Dethiothermospora halolimnae TaxID=3114390 RepID=UPI003CCBB95A